MKRKFIFLAMLLLTLVGGVKWNVLNAQETITIGSGTNSTYYGPIYDYYTNYAITQYIYTKDEIEVSGTINSIAFRIANDLPTTRNISVYLKNTDQESYTGAYNWVLLTEEDTAVYEGSINTASKDAEGWVTIQLTTPFEYEGGNLAVTINDKTGSYGSNYSMWYIYETTASRSIYGTSYQSVCDHLQLSTRYGTYYTNVGTWSNPVYAYRNAQVKFNITQASASVKVSAESISLGDVRLGNYWTEKNASANVEIKAIATTITSISCDNNFFTLNYDLNQNPVALNVSYNKEANVSGAQSGNITITTADCEPVVIPVTATAYTPVNGDIVEKAIEVTFTDNAFTHNATGMHDDYILPGEAEDGNLNDAVYKFTLANDAVVTANVNGTNAIAAIYKAEDLQGNGPSSDNNYNGIVSGPSAPTTFFYDFNDGDLSDFTLIEKDTETAGKYNHTNNWEIVSASGPDHSKCLISYSWKSSPSINNANNIIMTKDMYNISESSQLSFDIKDYSGYVDAVKIEVSTDGESFTMLRKVEPSDAFSTININIGADLVNAGLNYGNYYIALHHDEHDKMQVLVDNLALTDGSAKSRAGENQIDGVQYPAGTYYLVAAAEGDFTLNLSTTSLPAPESFAYTAPENNTIVEETNPELSWESAQYATNYDVYLGTTADALSKVAEDITATSFQTTGLSNNTKYYWQVVAKNIIGETIGEVYSFITPLDIPQNVTASSDEIYPDNNNVTIIWDAVSDVKVKGYNVWVKVNGDGNAIKHNGSELIKVTSYELSNMDYSLNGHEVYVTAVYEIEGEDYESEMSVAQTIKVTDYVALSGTIKDGTNPIAGAKISLAGTDEFGTAQTYTFTSGENGAYLGDVLVGSYTITVSRFDYKTIETTIEFDGPGNFEFSKSMESNPVAEFTVNAEEGRASWDAEYVSYNVYRRDSNGNVTSLATGIAAEEYQDTEWETLADGEYEYGVSAMMVETSYVTETFSTTSIPEGWTQNGEFEWSFNGTYAYLFQSWTSATPNNLITPLIDLSNESAPTISFKYSIGGSWTSSGYYNTLKVEVSESLNGPWTNIFTSSSYTSGFVNVEKSLSAFAGKKVYVKFVTDTDYSTTYIDDVVLPNTTSSESRINWSAPVEKGGITFTGEGNWNTAANWNTVPTSTDKVTINGKATITDDVTVGSIRIANGATLTVKSGAVLNVTNGISNANAAALVMEDGAQIIQTNSNVAATFNMNIVNPTQGWGKNKDGWQFIASPLLNAKTSAFETNGENNDFDLYKYDGTKEGAEWVNYKNHKRVGDTFEHNFNDGTLCGWTNLDATNKWTNSTGGIDGTYCLTSSNSGTSYVMSPKVLVEKGSKFYFTAKSVYDQNIVVAVSETGSIDDMATKLTASIGTSNWQWQDERYVSLDEYDGKEIYIIINTTSVYNGWATMSIDNLRLTNAGGTSDGTYETEFVNGRAYLASYQAATTATFEGTLNNVRAFSQELSYSGDEKPLANFHLLGNPFPFNMDWSKVQATDLATGYAVVNAEGNYEYLTSGTIAMGDGFFVKATAEGASFEYNADSKRSRNTDVNSINIIASGKAGKDNVIVNFAGKSEGFDKLQNFNDEIATVFVANNGKRYGIANVEEDATEVELSFVASQMGNYSISLDVNGEFEEVTLVDRFTGIETNMLLEDEYTFTATSNDNPNRFIIRLDNGQQTTVNSQFVYQSGEELILSIEGHVQIVDMLGRVVYSNEHANGDNRISVSEFNNAAYVVRVINEEGVKTQKVVIY